MNKLQMISGVRRGVAASAAAFGVALLSAGVASADDDTFQLRSRLGNFCLDTPSGNVYTPTVINPCDGSPTQRWHVAPLLRIESVAFPGACLGDMLFSQWVSVNRCYMNDQPWIIQPNGQVTGNLFDTPCLNVDGGVANPWTHVIVALCAPDNPAEEWDTIS